MHKPNDYIAMKAQKWTLALAVATLIGFLIKGERQVEDKIDERYEAKKIKRKPQTTEPE